MGTDFSKAIPKMPIFRRTIYQIPDSYREKYVEKGIHNEHQQMILYYLNQFGGFRYSKLTKHIVDHLDFMYSFTKIEWDGKSRVHKANLEFMQQFGDIKPAPLQRNWKTKTSVNETLMKLEGFSEEEISNSKKFLDELNSFYSSVQIEVDYPYTGLSFKDRIELAKLHSIPFLAKKPKSGGRFFHPETSYQRMNSTLRPLLRINGEKAAEIDLVASTLQFLDIVLSDDGWSLEDTVLSYEDPYEYFYDAFQRSKHKKERTEYNSYDREMVKTILYTLMYSKPENRRYNVNYKLSKYYAGPWDYDYLDDQLPEFLGYIELLDHKDEPIHKLINRKESTYAQSVLERMCLNIGIPTLPIHDSFLVPESKVAVLQDVMYENSQQLYGRTFKTKRKF